MVVRNVSGGEKHEVVYLVQAGNIDRLVICNGRVHCISRERVSTFTFDALQTLLRLILEHASQWRVAGPSDSIEVLTLECLIRKKYFEIAVNSVHDRQVCHNTEIVFGNSEVNFTEGSEVIDVRFSQKYGDKAGGQGLGVKACRSGLGMQLNTTTVGLLSMHPLHEFLTKKKLVDYICCDVSRFYGGYSIQCVKTVTICGFHRRTPKVIVGLGKGVTNQERMITAVAENIERFVFYNARPDIRNTCMSELGMKYVTHESLGTFADHVYDKDNGFFRRWQRADKCDWVVGKDLRTGENVCLPFESGFDKHLYYRPSTSGWALHLDKRAELNALLEIIERDALLISWFSGDFGVRLDVVGSDLMRLFSVKGMDLHVYEVSKDIRVPVVWIMARVIGGGSGLPVGALFFSSSCHLNIMLAIQSALNGLVQKYEQLSGANYIKRTVSPAQPYEHRDYYIDPGNSPLERINRGVRSEKKIVFTEIDHEENTDVALENAISRIEEGGFKSYAVDHSRLLGEGHDIRVIRAAIPGTFPLGFGTCESLRYGHLKSRFVRLGYNSIQLSVLGPHPFA